jgi:hypothetical protein
VFETRVLRRIFRPKVEEEARDRRRLHNEELHNLYGSPNVVRAIRWRTMRWVEHIARIGEMRSAYRILDGKPEGKRYTEDLGVDGRIILN